MSDYTKGPWHLGMKPGPMIYGPNGEQVADLTADLIPESETVGNARLIASAPDLLAALELIATSQSSEHDAEYMRGIARAAIKRARGEA